MRSMLTAAAATLAIVALAAGPASAHAGLMPSQLAPDTAVEGELVLAHGCGTGGSIPSSDEDDAPTLSVTLAVPEDLTLTPGELDGWDLTTRTDDSGRTLEVRWDAHEAGGVAGTVALPVEIDAAGVRDGTEFLVPVVQDCAGGEQLRWTLPGVEATDGQYPATRITVTNAAANAPVDPGTSPVVLAALLGALALGAGATSYVVTGRRQR